MLRDLLELSNSKALVAGMVLIDTLCFGTLALLVTLPTAVFGESAATTVLIALAITAPVLGLGIAAMSAMVPSRLNDEERARRAILAGAAMHLGIQSYVMIAMLCNKGPTSPGAYVLHGFGWMAAAVLVLAIATTVMKRRARRIDSGEMRDAPVAPDGRL